MKLNEALYIAFVIGYRGSVKRNAWDLDKDTKNMSINQECNPVDEDDPERYLDISNKPFAYVVLDNELKERIKYNLKNKIKSNYGLDLTEADVKAEDWRVDSLMYLSDQGLDCQNKVMVEQGVIKIDDLIPLLRHGYVLMDKTGDWYMMKMSSTTYSLDPKDWISAD